MDEIDQVINNNSLLYEARERDVNNPPHYQFGETGMEVIDIIDTAVAEIRDGKESFYLSQVLKYVLRYRGKGGVESLMKGSFYLLRLIAHMKTREASYGQYKKKVTGNG